MTPSPFIELLTDERNEPRICSISAGSTMILALSADLSSSSFRMRFLRKSGIAESGACISWRRICICAGKAATQAATRDARRSSFLDVASTVLSLRYESTSSAIDFTIFAAPSLTLMLAALSRPDTKMLSAFAFETP